VTRSRTRSGPGFVGAGLLAMTLTLSACGGGGDKPAAGGSASPSPYSPSPSPTDSSGPSADVSGSPSPSLPPDPVVKAYTRVLRNGKVPRPTVSASPAAFSGTVRYTDGLKLAVTGVDQAKVTDQGPGEFPGEPKTQISLRMTNGGHDTVRLNQVVVTAIYGTARRQARPVYDNRSRDFSGVLKPASSATAVYSFSVPKADLDQLTMLVDFDARYTVATFQGDPRSAQ
jgi:hypothetical protein